MMDPTIPAGKGALGNKVVCDHCRTRRIRCDYNEPCLQCQNCSLTCTRKYVPRRRGPKRGQGRVVKQLRAREALYNGIDHIPLTPTNSPGTPPSGPETPESHRPASKSYFDLVPRCVELYYEHIYPIMPLLYRPDIEEMLQRPLCPPEQTLLYALSAKTCFHMRGHGLQATGPDCWERAGRFFLDECEASRKSYDYVKEISLLSVISSFWMSTSSFEIKDDWKSSFYLKEALTFALGLRLHEESSYGSFSRSEALCCRRTFWQLFVTERSLAIFRKQDILLRKSPALSTESHPYESPSIAAGFFQLISTYQPLDESFVRAWNDGASADIDIATFLTLQQTLSPPPPFVAPQPNTYQPTLIQKADLLITQQWLRLTVWKSLAATRYRLTRNGPDESTRVTFPLNIAHRTASILISLPAAAVQAHGMGILEKVFEIGRAWVHVTELCELDGGGRATVAINPLGVFIRTLNACMESEKAFARALRALVREKPGVLRGDLGASLSAGNTKIDDRRLVEELGKDDVSEGFETGQLQIEGSSAQRVGLEANASVGHQLSCWGNHTSVSEVGGFSTGWYQDPCPRSHEEVDNLLTPPESGVQVDNALVRTGNSASLYQYGIGLEGSIFPLGHKSFFQM